MKNGTLYAVAFARDGHPTRLLNIDFVSSPAEVKTAVRDYRKDAKAKGHKNFGKT